MEYKFESRNTKTGFVCRIVNADSVRPLRAEILRPGLPEISAHYPQDFLTDTFHVACFDDQNAIGVCTWYPETLETFKAQKPFRLRGFATDPKYRRRGVGRDLMKVSLEVLEARNCDFVWFFAREVAFEFYSSLNFNFHGDIFDIPSIGPHKVMYKYL